MEKNYIEVALANGFKVIISKADGVFVALENPNGFIVSDTKLTKEQEKFFES